MVTHLKEFFRIYIDSFYEKTQMFADRALSRESKHLNKLLYDNTSGLRLIFEKSKNE